MLEPCDGKLSRTVLRGLGAGNSPRLPDPPVQRLIGMHGVQVPVWWACGRRQSEARDDGFEGGKDIGFGGDIASAADSWLLVNPARGEVQRPAPAIATSRPVLKSDIAAPQMTPSSFKNPG